MNLAVFDFDGTLTTKDSLLEFLKFYHGPVKVWCMLLLLSPVLILYTLRIIPNWRAKEILLAFFFGGVDIDKFQAACDRFSQQIIPKILRPEAIIKLTHHQRQGDRVVIISASPENWLQGWCAQREVELLGTRLQTMKGKMTGKIHGKNCYGKEKVRRLKELVDTAIYQEIYVYGDSKGDKELLQLASKAFYRRF